MKTKNLLVRLSEEEFNDLTNAYKNRLIKGDYISRSKFIRQLIMKSIIKNEKNK
jgi:hypothetical protein